MTRPVVLKVASRVVMTALILALALTVLAIAGIAALTFRSLPDRRPQSRLWARTREVER